MTIGWYVHHHGAGHLQRFMAVRALLPGVVGLGSLPRPAGVDPEGWVELPLDLPAEGAPRDAEAGGGLGWADEPARDPTAGGALHWAPLGCDGLRERSALIAAWVERTRPAAIVVDVSVEVALLARLLSVPIVVVAQRGVRVDPAHQLAFSAASAVVAPWTRETDLPGCGLPAEKLAFCGAISRFDATAASRTTSSDVLLLVGSGGHSLDADAVIAAAEATPERRWHVAGPLRVGEPAGGADALEGGAARDAGRARIVDHGPRADVGALLRDCGVVVATAGGNAVAEVAAARRPLVCLPQPRPFEEQRLQAEALRRADLAEVALEWPAPTAWPGLLARAERRDPARWSLLHDGRGAERLAGVVEAIAAGRPVTPSVAAARPAATHSAIASAVRRAGRAA